MKPLTRSALGSCAVAAFLPTIPGAISATAYCTAVRGTRFCASVPRAARQREVVLAHPGGGGNVRGGGVAVARSGGGASILGVKISGSFDPGCGHGCFGQQARHFCSPGGREGFAAGVTAWQVRVLDLAGLALVWNCEEPRRAR